MKIVVRLADLVSDRHTILKLIRLYLNPAADDARFSWLYLGNPYGKAKAWLAIDSVSQEVVGMAAAFPRRLSFQDHEEMGWVFGDFCIAPHCRSLGPALQLQRACIEGTSAGTMTFCYDFPSLSMLSVLKRLKISASNEMIRLAMPLRVDRFIHGAIPFPALAGIAIAIGNQLMKMLHYRTKIGADLTVAFHQGIYGEEFSHLSDKYSRDYGICVKRSMEYLNWRYGADPSGQGLMISVRRDGDLLGYVILRELENEIEVIDAFGASKHHVIESLLLKAIQFSRQRGKNTLSIHMASTHPWLRTIEKLGFSKRESAPLVIYHPPVHLRSEACMDSLKLAFMQTDRDS